MVINLVLGASLISLGVGFFIDERKFLVAGVFLFVLAWFLERLL